MARQLNYAQRAIVSVRSEQKGILPYQYQQTTSRLTYFISQSREHEHKVNYQRNLPVQETIVQEYRKNHTHLFTTDILLNSSKPPSSGKLKDRVKRNNIDYLYKFVDIIEKDFITLLEDSHLTHKSLKYLQTDVQTIFTVENYKTLRKLGVLPNKDVLVGRKAFADAVEKSIYHLKLLHTDGVLSIKRVKPIPEKLQVEVRYSFKGMTRLPKNEVVIDFIVKFNFSKASKQVHLIEFTDKHVKCDKSYVDMLKTIGVMALPLFGVSDCCNLERFELNNLYFNNVNCENIEEFGDELLHENRDLVTLEQLINPIYVHSD